MSPMFTTIVSPCVVIGSHLPSRVSTSRPAALAPTSSVMKLMSSCAPARTFGMFSCVIGG